MDLPDLDTRLQKRVAFRELFQPCPLPEEFAHINLDYVAQAWSHAHEVAQLRVHTYQMGGSAMREYPGAMGWELLTTEGACRFCQREAAKPNTSRRKPRVPLHIGYRCSATAIW